MRPSHLLARGALALALTGLVACARATQSTPGSDATGDPDATGVADAATDGGPDAEVCATQPCDILTQCGCGTTQACDVDVSDLMGTACRAINKTGHETDSCTSLTGCDEGYVCIGPTGGRACKKYCGSDADCASPRGQCVIDITDGTNPIAGLPSVCSSNCDPTNVAAGGCPAGFKCGLFTQPHGGSTYNIVDCAPAGAGTQGTNCKPGATPDDSLCGPDTLCTTVDGGTSYQCRQICNYSANTGCTGLTCIQFATPFAVAGIEYGVCN